MSFRLVPKSVTLNYLNGVMAVPCVISPNSVAFPAHYVKVHGCRYTDTFCGRIFVAIFAKVRENKCIMHRRSHVSDVRHYNITYSLLLANFNFNYKSDFPIMKM